MSTANVQDEEPLGSSLKPTSYNEPPPPLQPMATRLETSQKKDNIRNKTSNLQFKLRSSRLNKANGRYEAQQVKLRTRHLTFSLFMFVGAISSLAPFLTLHLTNRVGFLLFESDLLQLRSSLITNIVCLSTLVILGLIIVLITRTLRLFQRENNATKSTNDDEVSSGGGGQKQLNDRANKRRNLLLQNLLKRSAGSLAIISILSYLSLALIVPHIRQTQRLPYATFDCNANLIIIENCQQQFATHRAQASSTDYGPDGPVASSPDSVATLFDILKQLISGDLNGNNGRLANKLECLKYDEESLNRFRVPTRFLLNKCGLVCEPQRQQLHQFGDDLNWDLSSSSHLDHRPLVAPYSQPDFVAANGTRSEEEFVLQNEANNNADLISLKLCFSGEIDGANSNYKRFCIENLTSGDRSSSSTLSSANTFRNSHQPQFHPDQTLTVGQLNAILGRVRIDQAADSSVSSKHQSLSSQPIIQSEISSTITTNTLPAPLSSRIDQSTHYVNPIVQFESHFKNWPHLSRASSSTNEQQQQQSSSYFNERPFEMGETNDSKRSWCKFKPIPPFIVNNKPFSDIHCSLEHDYHMSTGPQVQMGANNQRNDQQQQQRRRRRRRRLSGLTPKIYLKKSTSPQSGDTSLSHHERCNIQCKVNILYQVLSKAKGKQRGLSMDANSPIDSFYLPMKYCLIVSGDGDKMRASNYYLVFRSIADASLLLSFILIDLQLLIESKDTKQFQLGDKKVRLIGLLLAITLPPLLVGVLFDVAASWMPNYGQPPSTRNYREGYLIQWLNERLIPWLSDTLERLGVQLGLVSGGKNAGGRMGNTLNSSEFSSLPFVSEGARHRQELVVDNYLIPFIIYAILMVAFAVSTFKLPLVSLASPLVQISSTEELGLVGTNRSSRDDVSQSRSTPTRMDCTKLAQPDEMVAIHHQASNVTDVLKDKLASLKQTFSSKSKTNSSKSDAYTEVLDDFKWRSHHKQSTRSLVAFALLALFMGLQFNLSQITQTQILLESFNLQNDLMQQQQQQQTPLQSNQLQERPNKVAIWFVLVSNSGGALILVLAILFGNELSQFLNEFYPFKKLPKIESQLSKRQGVAQFYKFLAISLVVYALRYLVLANMATQAHKMKWFLVVLFQLTELLNFPLTWFVLTLRAHELLFEYGLHSRWQNRVDGENSRSTGVRDDETSTRSLSLHLVAQSALAFVYYALARFLALFTHSFHASLYLHSDDIDWFVETFYDKKTASNRMSGSTNGSTISSSSTTTATGSAAPPESLFLPLPSERQTYLHASRSFVKYNSLVCLVFGLVLGSVFLFHKYQIYLEQRRLDRALKRSRTPQLDRENELIDERLSMDLAQIHARPKDSRGGGSRAGGQFEEGPDLTQHIPRTSREQLKRHEEQVGMANGEGGAGGMSRAKVHFRYGFGRRQGSSSTSSSSAGSYAVDASNQLQTSRSEAELANGTGRGIEAWRRLPQAGQQFRLARVRDIPMIVEEDQQQQPQQEQPAEEQPGAFDEQFIEEEEELEQITLTRSKRIQMVADDEDWSIDEEGQNDDQAVPISSGQHNSRNISPEEAQTMLELSMATSPPPAEFADDFEQMMPPPVGFASKEDVRSAETPPPENYQRGLHHKAATTTAKSPPQTTHQNRKRQITFAPLTTFIDQDGAHSMGQHESVVARRGGPSDADDGHLFGGHKMVTDSNQQHHRRQTDSKERRHLQTRLMASPEPSIDEVDDD